MRLLKPISSSLCVNGTRRRGVICRGACHGAAPKPGGAFGRCGLYPEQVGAWRGPMAQQLASPRSPAFTAERPSDNALHGKPWHFGDPHSRYRFIRWVLGRVAAAAAACVPVPTCQAQHTTARFLAWKHRVFSRHAASRLHSATLSTGQSCVERALRVAPFPPQCPSVSCPPAGPSPACCRVLGTGHYGVTYLCSSLKTGQLVAIKALDKLHPEYERDTAIEEILILAAVRAGWRRGLGSLACCALRRWLAGCRGAGCCCRRGGAARLLARLGRPPLLAKVDRSRCPCPACCARCQTTPMLWTCMRCGRTPPTCSLSW